MSNHGTETLKPKYLHVQQHAEIFAVAQYSQYKLQPSANELTPPAQPNNPATDRILLPPTPTNNHYQLHYQ